MSRFFTQHLTALRDALRRLVASPLNTLLSLIVIGAALALPSAGWVVLDNLRGLSGNAADGQQISLFLTLEASKKDVGEIEARLRSAKSGSWRFVSKDEALKRLQASEGMAEVVASLPGNPLPDAFVVEPTDTRPEAMEALAKTIASWPKVAHVQLDSAWIRRFDAFLRIGKLSLMLLAALFGGALIAVTFNTIRLQILAQSAEIEVAKLIGATDAFIRRPFYYFGALQGLAGGIFASLLVGMAGYLLTPAIGDLVALYGGNFVLRGLSPTNVTAMLGAGTLLGWLGGMLSAAIHLRRIGA